jgi:hypothetical protein
LGICCASQGSQTDEAKGVTWVLVPAFLTLDRTRQIQHDTAGGLLLLMRSKHLKNADPTKNIKTFLRGKLQEKRHVTASHNDTHKTPVLRKVWPMAREGDPLPSNVSFSFSPFVNLYKDDIMSPFLCRLFQHSLPVSNTTTEKFGDSPSKRQISLFYSVVYIYY